MFLKALLIQFESLFRDSEDRFLFCFFSYCLTIWPVYSLGEWHEKQFLLWNNVPDVLLSRIHIKGYQNLFETGLCFLVSKVDIALSILLYRLNLKIASAAQGVINMPNITVTI